jgi:hypothetical protein
MATVRPDRAALQTRVRHPLQTLRKYIRTYVSLEGAAVAVCYLALWFWVGLFLDYGLFWLTGYDWVQEFDVGFSPASAWNFRFILFLILALGLIGVVAAKVVLRLFREFRDDALALVLERRFPKELGDRLITAVEMADPKLAEKYGHSQEMVDVTVQEAAQRVEKLPVRDVFNWGRLYRQWAVALGLTLGIYLFVAAGVLALGGELYAFHDNASIWTERGITLRAKPYWLRSAQLEYVRFQDTAAHPGEMRVARDEQRPDLLVRAAQWVVADRDADNGWRALAWSDLPRFLPETEVARFNLPSDWPSWVIDLDDIDPEVPVGLVPKEWQNQTAGQIRKHLAATRAATTRRAQLAKEGKEIDADTARQAELNDVLERSGARAALDRLLDWKTWSVDKLYLQHLREDVRRAMKEQHAAGDQALEKIFTDLAEVADALHMSRTLRRLKAPSVVQAFFRGKSSKASNPIKKEEFNKYTISLRELKESARVTVRGEDYYTPYKTITLVPPPGLIELTVDKSEPAYIYWRLIGSQVPLKGKRQQFTGVPVGFTGEYVSLPVPAGTDLTLHAKVDRPLKPGIRLVAPAHRMFKNSVTLPTEVVLSADGTGFDIAFKDVARDTLEFDVEYADLDNVKGRRRVVIEPVQDQRPDWGETALGVALRTPKLGKGEADKGQAATLGMLVTPKAVLPFKAQVRDDYGLTDVSYAYEYAETEFELAGFAKESKDRVPVLVFAGPARQRWTTPILSAFRFPAGVGLFDPGEAAYWAWLSGAVERDVARAAKRAEAVKGEAPVFQFQERLTEKNHLEVPEAALTELLKPGQKMRPLNREGLTREFKLSFDESLLDEQFLNHNYFFSLEKLLPQLAPSGSKSSGPQLHYQLKIALLARDNNVETGPGTAPSKVSFNFLVVSENELLAQIVAEEEELRGNMERALKKLNDARTALADGITRLKAQNTRLDEPATRFDQSRKGVQETFGSVQEIYNNYYRILKEMKVNRVKADLIARVNEKIVKELREALSPNNGFFMLTDEALTKVWQDVDEAALAYSTAKEAKNDAQLQTIEQRRSGFLNDADKAQDYLDRLIAKLRGVLDSMGDEIGMKELIAQLVDIERLQRQSYLQLRDHHNVIEEFILNQAIGGPAGKQ